MGARLGARMVALAFACIAFPASHAFAETDEECASLGRIAKVVMERRQSGESLQTTIDLVTSDSGQQVWSGFRKMVMDAYEAPNYHTQEGKDRAIGEFRDAYQLRCMKGGN